MRDELKEQVWVGVSITRSQVNPSQDSVYIFMRVKECSSTKLYEFIIKMSKKENRPKISSAFFFLLWSFISTTNNVPQNKEKK